MKTNHIKIGPFLLSIAILFIQCQEEKMEPFENSTIPPGPVSNVSVENQHGQAKLTYTVPSDKDLLYVKAVYTIASGVKREVKTSYYSNSMIIDGFADTLQHEVNLYAVNRSEIESPPVSVTVTPLKNSIFGVYESLNVLADFGGIQISAKNPDKANVAILVLNIDSLGKWQQFTSVNTSQEGIVQSVRGLDTIPQRFGITVRDRFLNYTDTLFTVLSPMYEEKLTKSLYRELHFPNDAEQDNVSIGLGLYRLWDGTIAYWQRMMTKVTEGPQWISFDVGQHAHLSRIVIWGHIENDFAFYGGCIRKFEIWGSANPDPDGSWESWIKLGSYENIKPSGLPYGQQTAEDLAACYAGFSYSFPIDAPKLRYLRIKCLENWVGGTNMDLDEIQMYGDPR